jgi:hypothetical protein
MRNATMSQNIPTDKHGNVYYGSRTFAEAEISIHDDGVDPDELAEKMEAAGYVGVARRIRREYGVGDND